jgi:hypothetical protein
MFASPRSAHFEVHGETNNLQKVFFLSAHQKTLTHWIGPSKGIARQRLIDNKQESVWVRDPLFPNHVHEELEC